jgi:hypothetical protein
MHNGPIRSKTDFVPTESAWSYHVASGRLFNGGFEVEKGYSGHHDAANRPELEHVRAYGPIPRGLWRLGQMIDHPRLGPVSIPLMPVDHQAHGRSGFYIHGDNRHRNRTASSGCIILGRSTRLRLARSEQRLIVVY